MTNCSHHGYWMNGFVWKCHCFLNFQFPVDSGILHPLPLKRSLAFSLYVNSSTRLINLSPLCCCRNCSSRTGRYKIRALIFNSICSLTVSWGSREISGSHFFKQVFVVNKSGRWPQHLGQLSPRDGWVVSKVSRISEFSICSNGASGV